MEIKVAVAVITNRGIKAKTALSLMNLVSATKVPVFPLVASEGFTIAENRTYCVIQAIKNSCTHMLFIDDDMVFPEDTLDKLLAHSKPIVGVNSHSRMLPLTTTVTFEGDEMPKELFECQQVGFGVALIDLSIMQAIPQPWFGFETAINGKILNGEDGWLCDRARSNGFSVWCDPTLSVGHIGDYIY